MGRDTLKTIAEDTLDIMKQGWYRNGRGERVEIGGAVRDAIDGTTLHTPAVLAAMLDGLHAEGGRATTYEVTNETTLDAARRLHREGCTDILCLNFGSAKNPGGGFLGGASAQEESLARASGLYGCLLSAPDFYAYHRRERTLIYSDQLIHSPGVPVFKHEDGSPMESFLPVSFITGAAVNAGAVRENEPESVAMIVPAMRTRIEKLLALCAARGHRTLVLGAWGCGVFRNDPEVIAGFFAEVLKGRFAGEFERIVFAIKTRDEGMIGAFASWFGEGS